MSMSLIPEVPPATPRADRRTRSLSARLLRRLFRSETGESEASLANHMPRLVSRDLPFNQSSNKIRIVHVNRKKDLIPLIRHNWFHVLLRWPTYKSLTLLLGIWTSIILFYAGLYYWYDNQNSDRSCGLGNTSDPELDDPPIRWGAAFAFSLETCTTVGYGLPGGRNAFFENCGLLQFIIYCQMLTSMLSNAFLFAFLYSRIGKSENRAYQVLFGNKCVVRTDRRTKRIVLQVRVYDADSRHPVVEAHIRFYALLKNRDIFTDGHPQLVPLRIVNPNDELGGMLFTSIPTVVTHEIDCHSPLRFQASRAAQTMRLQSYNRLWRREVDAYTGASEDIICPICGESYGTHSRLRQHVRYNQIIEKQDEVQVAGSHQSVDPDRHFPDPSLPTLEELQAKFPLQELVVVVEGIDPLASGTFQALHSYMPEDIAWDAKFAPCLTGTEGDRFNYVDLNLFHNIEYVDRNDLENNNKKKSPSPSKRAVKASRQELFQVAVKEEEEGSTTDIPADVSLRRRGA